MPASSSFASTSAATSSDLLNLPTLLSDLAMIRQHQTALSSDLKDLQSSNRALWEEAIQSRERHTRHQETINKILRFLATVFGGQSLGGEEGRNVPEEVVEDISSGSKGKGKAEEIFQGGRLLLEDVKGRREARAREAEEDAAYEMDDDLEEISSGESTSTILKARDCTDLLHLCIL